MPKKKKISDDFLKAVLGDYDTDAVSVVESLLAEGFFVQTRHTQMLLMNPDTNEGAAITIYPAHRTSIIERAKFDGSLSEKQTVSDYLKKRKLAP